MDWKSTPQEKAKWLEQQVEETLRAQALIACFERLTQKWLKRVEAIHEKA